MDLKSILKIAQYVGMSPDAISADLANYQQSKYKEAGQDALRNAQATIVRKQTAADQLNKIKAGNNEQGLDSAAQAELQKQADTPTQDITAPLYQYGDLEGVQGYIKDVNARETAAKDAAAKAEQKQNLKGVIQNYLDGLPEEYKKNPAFQATYALAELGDTENVGKMLSGAVGDIGNTAEKGRQDRITSAQDFTQDKTLKTIDNENSKNTAGFDNEARLRTQFNQFAKNYNDVKVAYNKIQKSGALETSQGDMALLYSYMKMLDPGSTVREGEYAKAEQTANIPQRIVGLYNKAAEGTGLTSKVRQGFLAASKELYETENENFGAIKNQYKKISKNWNLNADNVVGGFDNENSDPLGIF